MSEENELNISEEQLPTHLERLYLMYHWILDDDPEQERLEEIGDRLEKAGDDEQAMEKPLEDLWRIENTIFEKYRESLSLDKFDIFPEDDEELDDIRRRFMLQCIINYLEDIRLEEGTPPVDESYERHNEALAEKAREIADEAELNPESARSNADELLRYYEDVFVFDYYGFGDDDEEEHEHEHEHEER